MLFRSTLDIGGGVRGALYPFLIHDVTPREQRAFPAGKATTGRAVRLTPRRGTRNDLALNLLMRASFQKKSCESDRVQMTRAGDGHPPGVRQACREQGRPGAPPYRTNSG